MADANEESKEPQMTDEEKKKKEEEEKKIAAEAEPDTQDLKNPSRILKAQEKKIKYKEDGKYYPVVDTRFAGFVVLRDNVPPPEDEKELYWDDEEIDPNAPNPNLVTDMELPAEFEFDPAVQNAQ